MSSSLAVGSQPPARSDSTWSPVYLSSSAGLPAAPARPTGNGRRPSMAKTWPWDPSSIILGARSA